MTVSPLSRRSFVASVLLSPCALAAAKPGRRKRPNILLLIADDWSWPHASILGDPVVKTPVFDRVARDGALFENAFVSSPSCTPSRGAVLAGEYPWRLRHAMNLGGSLPSGKRTYPDLFAAAGYHVGHSGKGFWPTKNLGRTTKPAGKRYRGFQEFAKARPAGKPFCFWFGGPDPHRPYTLGSGVKSGMAVDAIRTPSGMPDNKTVRSDICDYYWEVQRFDRQCGDILAHLERTGELDDTLVIMTSDNGMPFPRQKATLYDGGVRVPLAIRWSGACRAGRTIRDFVSLCDLAPTLLEAAGLEPGKEMTGKSLVDILTSEKSGQIEADRTSVVLGMERHCTPYPCRAIRTDAFLYIRNYGPETWDPGKADFPFNYNIDPSPTKTYMMEHREAPGVKSLYALAFGKRPGEELYDLKKDPGLIANVAGTAAYAEAKAALAKQLGERLRASQDPRVLGKPEQFDRWD